MTGGRPAPARVYWGRVVANGLWLGVALILVALVVCVCGLCAWANLPGNSDDGSYDPDLWRAERIRHAIKWYRARHEAYPDTLDRLVEPDDGRPPLIEDGPRALLDMHGQRFHWETRARGGVEDVVVWTTSKSGRRKQYPAGE